MATNSHGLTGVIHGTPSLTGFVVSDVSISKKPGVTTEVFDEDGNRVYSRYADQTNEASVEMVFNGGAEPTVGAVLTFDGTKYEVVGVELKYSNKDVLKYSLKLKNSENLTLA